MIPFIILLLFGIILLQAICLGVLLYHKKVRESEYYTDYVHGGIIMRVYKPEFEYQAIGSLSPNKILDRGSLSAFYDWAVLSL